MVGPFEPAGSFDLIWFCQLNQLDYLLMLGSFGLVGSFDMVGLFELVCSFNMVGPFEAVETFDMVGLA